jgi:hypothetical protein
MLFYMLLSFKISSAVSHVFVTHIRHITQGKIDTWHIISEIATDFRLQMPLEISEFFRNCMNLIIQTTYNLGINDTDMAFHVIHLYDDYDESDEIKYKHISCLQSCQPLPCQVSRAKDHILRSIVLLLIL